MFHQIWAVTITYDTNRQGNEPPSIQVWTGIDAREYHTPLEQRIVFPTERQAVAYANTRKAEYGLLPLRSYK